MLQRGLAGSDPSTWGRIPVVLEVLFHSRAISTRGIQSEIVLGHLHYLVGFVVFEARWYTCRNTIFSHRFFIFAFDVRKLLGPRLFRTG